MHEEQYPIYRSQFKKKKKNFLGRWAKELSISNVSSVREGKVFFSPLQVTKN